MERNMVDWTLQNNVPIGNYYLDKAKLGYYYLDTANASGFSSKPESTAMAKILFS